MDRDFIVTHGHRGSMAAFANSIEDDLRAANAETPPDQRKIHKLMFLSRRARDLVFSR
jgi:hypothetical protein